MARPLKTFHEFVGQRRAVQHTTRLIDGAKKQGKPCPSLQVVAPPGFGKTSFADAVATEYGSDLHVLLAGDDTRAADVCTILSEVKHADVVFIDEAHSLRRDAQQVLYLALDQNKVPTLSEGRLDRSQFKSVASFTLILATNEPGSLKRALRSRLTPIEFDPYSMAELKVIVERVALKDGVEITPQAARRLAEVAQGSPRHICRRVEALRLFWPGLSKLGQDHVEDLLASEGVDHRGFWPHQRLYLFTLAASPGSICSLERLAIKLGCDPAHIRQDIEPFLIDQGLVEPSSGRGRMLTATGLAIVAEIAAEKVVVAAVETTVQEGSQC